MEKYTAPDRKRIPYGMMNFAVIRRDDCYYVDKTRFIPMIEEADKFFFFIRPRRFGKSLTVSMLQHYYDILAKDKFEALLHRKASYARPEQLSGTIPQLLRNSRRTAQLPQGTGRALPNNVRLLL